MSNFYYYVDRDNLQCIRSQIASEVAPATWIQVPEHYAQQLIEGQNAGKHIYINDGGTPALWETPPKPPLKWDEEAILTPLAVHEGTAIQNWIVSKVSIEEKLNRLKEFRQYKQSTNIVPIRVRRVGPNGEAIYKNLLTDPGTWVMMNAAGLTAMLDPNYVFRDWKFDDGTWESIDAREVITAWKKCSEAVELCFSIESAYTRAILAGTEVNIHEWVLISA